VPVTQNTTLLRLNRGQVALGLIVRLCTSPEIARLAKVCDHDFLFIDMQHGSMSIETVVAVCQSALDANVTALVRVPLDDAANAVRALDNGAMGIIVPDVETVEQARAAVDSLRLPPLGRRSVGSGYPQLGYAALATPEASRLLNEQTLLVAMIESARAVENAQEIAAVPGIDVLHVGSNDLLAAMGLSHELGTDRHLALCARVLEACRAHAKHFGIGGVRTPELQSQFIRMGARMLTTQSDLAFLIAAAGERARLLRTVEAEAATAPSGGA
jgi:2-keto-3-deoxy-L-rhamnonate aldolase RhmA